MTSPPLAPPLACRVWNEPAWRCAPPTADESGGIAVSRWTTSGDAALRVSHRGDPDRHCIAVALRSTSVRLQCGGVPVVDGRVAAGTVQVTAPATPASAVFHAPCDTLHLHAPQQVLTECHADLFGSIPAGNIVLDDPRLHADPALERLGQALAVSHLQDSPVGRLFADSVALAIVSRVVASHFHRKALSTPAVAKLPAWRLRRALDYIEANLAQPIGLADIAGSTGLTRMHFAAQFRLATGMRPHEYLLRRRIERAQDLLRQNEGGVLDVALRCGFRTQSHFTAVFKRFVGDTPHCWRMKTAASPNCAYAGHVP